MEKISFKKKLVPLILTILVVVLDQLSKNLIVNSIPPFTIGWSFFGDLLRIIHVSNEGIAFSMGDSLPGTMRSLLFSAAPLAVIVLVFVIYFRNNEFLSFQRWCICGVLGGGLGNLYDRIFRSEGVIDFIDVKFFGIFGLNRWPTFNIADSAVVIFGILLAISFLHTEISLKQSGKSE